MKVDFSSELLRCDTESTVESNESSPSSIVHAGNLDDAPIVDRSDSDRQREKDRLKPRGTVDETPDVEVNNGLLEDYMIAPSTSEERQNDRYARKVGINFSISRGDYLTLFSGLSDDASASIITDITDEGTLSPQYGKKDDHFTFREMYGDVNQILEQTPQKSTFLEDCPQISPPKRHLITPRTRTAMINHDQVRDKLRERAAILSIDWATKEYVAPSLARRLRDFEFAQKKRRKKFGSSRQFGILGLYDYLSAVREDVAWAEDAAFRRSNCLPYIRWCDFVESKSGGGASKPYFAYGMVFICSISLIVSIGMNGWALESMSNNPSLGPSADTLIKMGAKDSNLIVNSFEVWRLFTPMILHGGLIHFALNCFAMFYIGRAVEQNHGFKSTTILFTVPAIGSTIISAIFLPELISVGASGGIFGLIGACTMDIVRNRKVIFSSFINKGRNKRHNVLVVAVLGLDIFINMLLGLTPFTDNFMHLGGFILGCLCASTMLNLVDLFDIEKKPVGRRKYSQFVWRYIGVIATALVMIATTVILFQGDGVKNPCKSCGFLSCVSFPPWNDYDEKWYYCDNCGRVLAYGRKDEITGEYASIEMHCPAGNTISFSLDGYDNGRESLQKNLPSFCRDRCL